VPLGGPAEVGCVGEAALNLNGCFWQQPLEAALLALTPIGPRPTWTREDFVAPAFEGDRRPATGSGDPNADFLRADSVLVVLFSNPTDDCSTSDPRIFSESTHADVGQSLRCFVTPDSRYPVDRYVNGLLGLRRSPSRLVVGGLVGVPQTAELLTYEDTLALPEMQVREGHGGQEPACVGSVSTGFPARRFVSFLAGLRNAGSQTIVGSVCSDDPPLLRLFDAIQNARHGHL
jgi:hypothetical protein